MALGAGITEIARLQETVGTLADEIQRLQAVLDAAVDRSRQAERLITHAIRFMSKEQVGHWQGVRAWQEDDTLDRALDGEVKP